MFFCDDVAISSDGNVFISDATASLRVDDPELLFPVSLAVGISGQRTGRLLKYTPSTNALETLIDHLTFAVGVALSHDESFVLVTDGMATYRIKRYWLKGPMTGTEDVFIPSLPGLADGISRGSNGSFWISVFAYSSPLVEEIFQTRLTRWLFARLPTETKHDIIGTHGIIVKV